MNEVDCILVGAGVIGLAVARALAQSGREVVILERERQFGMHTSARNSEVIHAGIHYVPGSLKARLCVAGKALLYRYCADHRIEHRRCGKFTVATQDSQIATLHKIQANALGSGVLDLEWLDADQALKLEPALACVAALSSPSTGIIDSHGLMQSLLADAEALGATIAYDTKVSSLIPSARGIEVAINDEAAAEVRARLVVNAAGLYAHEVAAAIQDFPPEFIPKVSYAKGSYFSATGKSPFSRLIYPVPPPGGHLGIHMTLDLAGKARFGPDTEWVDHIDYSLDPRRAAIFHDAIKEYWPACDPARLLPAYAGIRPKLSGPGEAAHDFCISGPQDHGVPGIINLLGIDSPGLTASLALGELVAALAASS
jgi:L-2-hydroxyglutarate oxidase LhgO